MFYEDQRGFKLGDNCCVSWSMGKLEGDGFRERLRYGISDMSEDRGTYMYSWSTARDRVSALAEKYVVEGTLNQETLSVRLAKMQDSGTKPT